MIDQNATLIAIRARLVGDVTLAGLVETVGGEPGVFRLDIPATVAWSKPVIECGWQAGDRDPDNGYGQDGSDLRLRLMAHDRGDAPGIGSFDDLYAALNRAVAALQASPLSVGGQTVWYCRWMSDIPETSTTDTAGYLRMAAGKLMRVRSY